MIITHELSPLKSTFRPLYLSFMLKFEIGMDFSSVINLIDEDKIKDKEKSWDDATEAQMKQEYKLCKKWFSKHKRKLPKSTELFKDPRNWSAGITIR